MSESVQKEPAKKTTRRFYRKDQSLFALVGKVKLWPSRRGLLHGIRSMEVAGDLATITTHCGKVFLARDSRTSRASRWLRNKIFAGACPECGVPQWKLEKFHGTVFKKRYGATLPGTAATGGSA